MQTSTLVSGQDIHLKVTLSSGDQVPRSLSLRVNAQTMLYTGVPAANVLTKIEEHTLQPGQGNALTHERTHSRTHRRWLPYLSFILFLILFLLRYLASLLYLPQLCPLPW